jgi:hypothetical protein
MFTKKEMTAIRAVNVRRTRSMNAYRKEWKLSLSDADKNVNLFLYSRGRLTMKQLDDRDLELKSKRNLSCVQPQNSSYLGAEVKTQLILHPTQKLVLSWS